MLPPAWIEDNLLALGAASVLAGFLLGILCSAIQACQTKGALEQDIASRPSRMPSVKPPPPAREPTPGMPRAATVHRIRPGAEPIVRVGAAGRARTPGRRA